MLQSDWLGYSYTNRNWRAVAGGRLRIKFFRFNVLKNPSEANGIIKLPRILKEQYLRFLDFYNG